MSKHTSGPWSFWPSIPEEGVECFWIENGVKQITGIDGPQNDEQEANARLIAAAPELLEALIAVVSVADRKTDEFDLAHAAIAKAIGQQP